MTAVFYEAYTRDRYDPERPGLRDWMPRVSVVKAHSAPRWPWVLALVAFFLGFVLRGELLGAERSCISVRVTNGASRTIHRAFGPATLFADVRLQRDPEHRRLEVRWAHPDRWPWLPGFTAADPVDVDEDPTAGNEGAYEKDLHGADERISHQAKLTNLAGGTYDVVAAVYRDRDKRNLCGRARTRVVVTSPPNGDR